MKANRALSLLATLTLGLALAAPLAASDQPAAKPNRAKAVQKIKELGVELDLTADQKDKIKTLLQEQKEKLKEIRNDASLSKVDKAAKLREQQTALAAKLKEVLTAEQYAKWEKARDEALADRKAQRKNAR